MSKSRKSLINRISHGVAALALCGLGFPVMADGLQALESFVANAQSGEADFVQTVTTPASGEQQEKHKQSSGVFSFERPGKFRFDYQQPFEQLIVGDGQTLWFYDADLAQVTQRAQAEALAQTPAAILTGTGNLHQLESYFTLESQPSTDGLDWVLATPRAEGGQIDSLRIGFADGQLRQLDMSDAFGQQSVLEFSHVKLNQKLDAERFQFTPPPGVDILAQ